MSKYAIKKAVAYLKHYGVSKLVKKYIERKKDRDNYMSLRLNEIADEDELKRQSEFEFLVRPLVSIIIPVYNAPKEAFVQTLLSVKEQSYCNWELCINDAGTEPVEELVRQVFSNDERVKYNYSKKRLGISLNSNAALELATGEYVAFLDHDDILTKDALFHMVSCANQTGADMIYSDEDKVSEDFTEYFRPYRKPDFNKTLFLSNNYVCHFCMIRKSIIEDVGGFESEFDGAQDYDLFLKSMEKANRIEHVCRVLYHWRVTKSSTSDNPFNKNYAEIAGKKSLEAYFARNNAKNIEIKETDDPGYFQVLHNNYAEVKDCYELILQKGMEIKEESVEKLYQRAAILGGDIIVPKQVKNGKYFYNGVAKRGDELTQSLVGKPKWYRGKFNLGITAMEVCLAPSKGILVKKELADRIKSVNGLLDNRSKEYEGLIMVYEPASQLEIKR